MDTNTVPDISQHPEQWFRYFDTSRNGSLSQREVEDALIHTFPAIEGSTLRGIIQSLWPLFDHDGNGCISLQEFISRDGLCDTIVAQMNPHFNEIDAPTETRPIEHSAPPSYEESISHRNQPYSQYQQHSYHSSNGGYPQHQTYHGCSSGGCPQQYSYPQHQQPTYGHQSHLHNSQVQQSSTYPSRQQIQVQCGRCRSMISVIPPAGVRLFQVSCVSCGTANQVQI